MCYKIYKLYQLFKIKIISLIMSQNKKNIKILHDKNPLLAVINYNKYTFSIQFNKRDFVR